MQSFSLVRSPGLHGTPRLDVRGPSPLSLEPGRTEPMGFTRQQTPQASAPARPAHDFGRIAVRAPAPAPVPVQAKLTVNRPGDRYEREADAVADQVMRTSDAGPGAAVSERAGAPTVQRLAAHRDPFPEDAEIRPEGEQQDATPGAGIAQTLRPAGSTGGRRALSAAALGAGTGGAPMETGARRFMETRFGADFSRVRIHADGHAAGLNRSLNARAFTHGAHIWFGENEYRPGTTEGRRVLAHELTHVVQQGAAQAGLPVREQVAAAGTVQRLGALGPVTASNVYPWGQPGPVGDNHDVSTDRGSTVAAWRGYLPLRDQYRYWCHGHSLDSYANHDYSVYSGGPLETVIRDEWTPVRPDQTRAGDIAVWTNGWDHSAKFTSPVVTGGTLDPAASQLSTKNGQNALATMSLNGIAGVYGGAGIQVFRK